MYIHLYFKSLTFLFVYTRKTQHLPFTHNKYEPCLNQYPFLHSWCFIRGMKSEAPKVLVLVLGCASLNPTWDLHVSLTYTTYEVVRKNHGMAHLSFIYNLNAFPIDLCLIQFKCVPHEKIGLFKATSNLKVCGIFIYELLRVFLFNERDVFLHEIISSYWIHAFLFSHKSSLFRIRQTHDILEELVIIVLKAWMQIQKRLVGST